MIDRIKEALENADFLTAYTDMCTLYADADNARSFSKSQINAVFKEVKFSPEYHHTEKSFTKDYICKNLAVRFILSFEDGMVELYYMVEYKKQTDEHTFGRWDAFAKLLREDFDSTVPNSIPVAANLDTLKAIIQKAIRLHNKIIKELK